MMDGCRSETMGLDCCGTGRKQPIRMTATEQLVAGTLRPGECVIAAVPALTFWDLWPPVVGGAEPFGEPRRYDLTVASLVAHDASQAPGCGGRGMEVALLGLRVGWLSQEHVVAMPICAGACKIHLAFAASEAEDLKAASDEKARFFLVLPAAAEGTEAAAEQSRLLANLAAQENILRQYSWPGATGGFPCASGAFDWLWSYAPLSYIPRGLERPLPMEENVDSSRARNMHYPASPLNGSASELSLYTFSLNCGGQLPPPTSELLPLFSNLAPTCGRHAAPGLIVAALQEICPLHLAFYPSIIAGTTDSEAAEAWGLALDEALAAAASVTPAKAAGGSPAYVRIFTHSLVGLLLVVWVRADMRHLVEEEPGPCGSVARCGAYGAANKGAVAASLNLGGHWICLASVHLAAGEGQAKAAARSRDFEEILWQLGFGHGAAQRNALEHDLVLVAGDFNSRLSSTKESASADGEAAPGSAAALLGSATPDEVSRCMDERGDEATVLHRTRRGAWALFKEAPVAFPPTYKFVPGEDSFVQSASFAWCDRIVWWARPARFAVTLQEDCYRRVESVRFSDHRPVSLNLGLAPVTVAVDPTGGKQVKLLRKRSLTSCRQQ